MYDFFLTRRYRTYASDTGGGGDSGGWYELPRTTHKLLGADDQCVKDGGIPIVELREYVGETDVDVEYRLKQFPLCRYVAEQISSYRVMSYERTLRTITVILEINIDVLYRQCHLFYVEMDVLKSYIRARVHRCVYQIEMLVVCLLRPGETILCNVCMESVIQHSYVCP